MAVDERPAMEWVPRARVSLVVRFEEFGTAISSKPPATKQMLRKGTSSDKDLEYVVDPDSPPGAKRYLLQPKAGGKTKQASADKLTWPLWGIIPMTVNHTRNGLEKADTATVTLAFTDAPFDPRCIRSCAITYYLGTITADQAAAEPDADGPTMVPDTWTDARGNVRSNERFDGWVDSWEADYEDGVPVVKLECRDNRAVLIDQESPPQLHLDPKLTLDKAVADYLSNFPQFAGISVEWRGDGDAPTLSSVMPSKGHEKGTNTGKEKSTVMDYLKEMCESCGCILMMEGPTLVVTKPRTVFKGHPSRPSDSHSNANRTMNGTRLPYRTFVYGHNVKTMKFGRKYNAAAPSNLEVRCYIPSLKKTIIARFPDITTQAMPGNGADNKWAVRLVTGITSRDQLKIIAQGAYEQQGRKELTAEVTTTALASFGGDNFDPDILDLLPGDTFEAYLMKEQDMATTVGGFEDAALQHDKIASMMRDFGYTADISKAYADAYVAGGFTTAFYAMAVKTDWDVGSGVSISVNGTNYVEVRLDKEIT